MISLVLVGAWAFCHALMAIAALAMTNGREDCVGGSAHEGWLDHQPDRRHERNQQRDRNDTRRPTGERSHELPFKHNKRIDHRTW
jgi:hypothetical protein